MDQKAERKLIVELMMKYRMRVALGLLTLVLVDVLEVIPPIILKETIDLAMAKSSMSTVVFWAAVYMAVAIAQAACRYAWRMLIVRSSMLAGGDLRNRFAAKLFECDLQFFDRRSVGDLMSHATSDIDAIRMSIGPGLISFADALFYIVTVPIAMVTLSPKLTALALLPLPIIPFMIAKLEKSINRRFERVQESFSRISAFAQEAIGGVRVLKAFAVEARAVHRFRLEGEESIHRNLELARVQTLIGPALDFTMSTGMVALIAMGGKLTMDESISLGTFVAFQRYIQKMIWPMTAIGLSVNYYQRALASATRLLQIFREPNLLRVRSPERSGRSQTVTVTSPEARGRIELRDLWFRFPGSDDWVLKGVSVAIEPQTRIALTGRVGSGKSALLSVIARLYPVERGMVFIDGVDVNDWNLEDLRQTVGYVGQESFLFSQSVRENVLFEGSDPAVREACRIAAIEEEIERLPDRYETLLGEKGTSLSGGQKQRLSIARVLARKPKILLLDDAFSAVDTATETRILERLASRGDEATEVLVAHRLSSFRYCDRILVFESGKLVADGSHGDLLRRSEVYREWIDQQRIKEEVEQYDEKRFD